MPKNILRTLGLVAILTQTSMAALAETEQTRTLRLAVSFALTGSDGADVEVEDLPSCVFRIGDATYFMNDIDPTRLSFGRRRFSDGERTIVGVHGSKTIRETTSIARPTSSPELNRALLARDPEFFSRSVAHRESDFTLQFATSENDRLVRAWRYIYRNGCKGAKSPF